jgi:hypothetical protein
VGLTVLPAGGGDSWVVLHCGSCGDGDCG